MSRVEFVVLSFVMSVFVLACFWLLGVAEWDSEYLIEEDRVIVNGRSTRDQLVPLSKNGMFENPLLCLWSILAAMTFVLILMFMGQERANLNGGNAAVIDAQTRLVLCRCQAQKGKANGCWLISQTEYRKLSARTMNEIALYIKGHIYYDTGRIDQSGRVIFVRRKERAISKKRIHHDRPRGRIGYS